MLDELDQRLIKVASHNISVVIQGPLYRHTSCGGGVNACITSVKKHLPHAEIIISTWPNEDLSGISADLILTTSDPGALIDHNGNLININRQIVSTITGIKASKRDYVLKIRADHILTGYQFAVMGKYKSTISQTECLFNKPITVCSMFIRNPAKVPILFHISDLAHFGTREDMIAFWDQRLKTQEELFFTKPNMSPIGNFIGCSSMRMVPEQSLMLSFLAKRGIDICLKNPSEISPELVSLSENIIAKNFTVLNWQDCQIEFPERFRKSFYSLKTLYEPKELKELAELEPHKRMTRYRKIWLKKYVFFFTSLVWWFSLASIILTKISPSFTKTVRAITRKIIGNEHPYDHRS